MSVSLAAVVACHAPATLPSPPKPAAPAVEDPARCASCATVTGRVVLGGAPVERFGVRVTTGVTGDTREPPRTFDDGTGRFELADIQPGIWDIVIAGPGFARLVVANQDLRRGGRVDLGELAASAGALIEGRVVDASGAGVPSATVAFVQAPMELGVDPLAQAMVGNCVATTDANGWFSIGGVASYGGQLEAIAGADAVGGSVPKPLDVRNQAILLNLLPGCTIRGTVDALRDFERPVVVARSLRGLGTRFAPIDADGHYKLFAPAGLYDVTVAVAAPDRAGKQRVECRPQGVAEASFPLSE